MVQYDKYEDFDIVTVRYIVPHKWIKKQVRRALAFVRTLLFVADVVMGVVFLLFSLALDNIEPDARTWGLLAICVIWVVARFTLAPVIHARLTRAMGE